MTKRRPKMYNGNAALNKLLVRFGDEVGFLCALCGARSNLCTDHDHSCHPAQQACVACVRGFLCSACNNLEGVVAKALARGAVDNVSGALADYWARPPFQEWLAASLQAPSPKSRLVGAASDDDSALLWLLGNDPEASLDAQTWGQQHGILTRRRQNLIRKHEVSLDELSDAGWTP